MVVEKQLQTALEPHVAALGYEVLEVTFGGEGGRRVLRLTLDGPEGITLDQCAAVSRALGPVLDGIQELPAGYMLEVSSPGINRPLTKLEHYRRFLGETVKLRLKDKQDGGLTVTGVLRDVQDGVLTIETPVGTKLLPLDRVARARLHRDIDAILRAARKPDPAAEAATAARRWKR
jgi:ribosome maturation factor RimP